MSSNLSVALQFYSVRDLAEKDLKGTMKKVKEIGYDTLELAGLYDNTPEEFKAAMVECGLTAVSAHVPFAEMEADAEGTVKKYKFLGCRYMAVPWLSLDYCPGGEKFETTLAVINKVGKLCVENGMTLLYHNHEFEFKKMDDGSYALDHLYATVPAGVLQTEIDTCWVKVAGEDPVAYVKKYAGRSPVVHLKDFYKEGDAVRPGAPGGIFEFRPLGKGMQDFPPIIKAAEEIGADWIVVEQDKSHDRPSIDAVKISREYLKSLGY